MPAPPPESEPATIKTRPFIVPWALFGGPDRRVFGAARGREDRLADVIEDAGEQGFILALRHHPDHRLGAGITDDQPAGRAEPGLTGCDRLLYTERLERLAFAEAHIAQQLRHRGEQPAD